MFQTASTKSLMKYQLETGFAIHAHIVRGCWQLNKKLMRCNGSDGGWRRALRDLSACSASRARRVLKDRLAGTASRARWDSRVQQVLSAPPERMEIRWEQLPAVQGHSGKELGNVRRCHHADPLLPSRWVR